MKKLRIIVLMFTTLLLLGITTSCDKVEELTEKDISVKIVETTPQITLESSETGRTETNASIRTSKTQDYLDKLKSVKIKRFTYKVVRFQGTENYEIEASVYAAGMKFFSDKFKLKNAYSNKTSFEVTNTKGLNKLADLLKKGNNVPLIFEYTADSEVNTPVKFRVEITIEATVTAGLL